MVHKKAPLLPVDWPVSLQTQPFWHRFWHTQYLKKKLFKIGQKDDERFVFAYNTKLMSNIFGTK